MKKIICFLVTVLILSINLFAGWTRTFGGSDLDVGSSVQQTTDGGYIIAGFTQSYGAGGRDFYLIKTDIAGDTLWTQIFGGSNTDYGRSVQQTTDGGYIITGITESYGVGNEDVYLIKTDINGDTIWTKTFGGSSDDGGLSVQQTTDGGYIISGYTGSYGAGGKDVYLIKTDASGDTLWTKTFGGGSEDDGWSVQQINEGGYIIAGYTGSYGAGGRDVYLIKTDTDGDTLWTKTFGGSSDDGGTSVQQVTDGGYIITGYTCSYGSGLGDVYLIRTDIAGDTLWTKTFGGSNIDEGISVQQTTDGGFIIDGNTFSYGAGVTDIYLIKTDASGDTIWTKTYGGSSREGGYSVQQTTDGGYIVTGYTGSYGAGNYDVYLIKTDENGVTVEETAITLPGNFSYSIEYMSNNNICLKFSLPYINRIELNIYDTAGRYISTPISGNYSSGIHRVNFKLENSGVYFFNLISDYKSEKGKFIVF